MMVDVACDSTHDSLTLAVSILSFVIRYLRVVKLVGFKYSTRGAIGLFHSLNQTTSHM